MMYRITPVLHTSTDTPCPVRSITVASVQIRACMCGDGKGKYIEMIVRGGAGAGAGTVLKLLSLNHSSSSLWSPSGATYIGVPHMVLKVGAVRIGSKIRESPKSAH